MQFSSFIYTAVMAATSINALPSFQVRQTAIIGNLDVYDLSGCIPSQKPAVPGFNLTAGGICNQFPTGSIAVNVTSLNTGCTVQLYTDTTCTSSAVITLPAAGLPNGGLEQCEEGRPGIQSYNATCTS